MKIAVIGNKGMLGSYVEKYFREERVRTEFTEDGLNKDVFGFDREELDITDEGEVQDKLKDLDLDFIINCAAYTNVEQAEEEYELAYKINGLGVKHLATFCKENKVNFFHISTDMVFNGTPEDGVEEYVESDKPMNKYGQSKLEGENFILKLVDGQKDSNFNVKDPKFYIVRTSWLFGENANNFIAKITKYAKELPELKVVTDEVGCPTYIKDLTREIERLIIVDTDPGIYHVCSSNNCSRYEFAKEILKLQGIKTPIRETTLSEFNRKAQVANVSVLKNTKLLVPGLRTWEEMLGDFLQKSN